MCNCCWDHKCEDRCIGFFCYSPQWGLSSSSIFFTTWATDTPETVCFLADKICSVDKHCLEVSVLDSNGIALAGSDDCNV